MPTIADLVAANGDFSIVLRALQAADLVDVLADASASLTVFAPTNGAFLSLAERLGYEGPPVDGVFDFLLEALTGLAGGGDPTPPLTSILKFHVVGAEVSSSALLAAGSFTPLEGPAVVVANDNKTLYDYAPGVADPMLVAGMLDLGASNGVVHVIDGVLLPVSILPAADAPPTMTAAPVPYEPVATAAPVPDEPVATAAPARPTIAELVTANDDFTVLLAALQAAGLVDVVADASASLTVFAPTDAAFVALAERLGYAGHAVDGVFDFLVEALTGLAGGGDPIPLLTSILKYHVVGAEVSSSALVAAGFFTPLEGPAVVVANDNKTLYDYAPGVADPMLVAGMLDLAASNGVVHVIDGVLLPIPVFPVVEESAPMETEAPMPTKAPVQPEYTRYH
ncbi:hypothetical protein BU14_0288s0031 [Porphyra umbilicalis]|uniref:FAS1 domain-containing protein n=1 Tax=Porphyra umbilicalis TaxID=2786 RepID=A0A1X6P0T8_PORUM|nr:hypothetical protein BU14_0288s0031 [Porphyra umbilicalis]|eukprot:OSX74478.1 hypothetical protein BU14_0288s0031 [Porphyra umbilicalis]